jgi:multidrug efflux pump subunit AcrB
MLAIVRIALNKPYTFVVMAMLIVIFGVSAAIKTPADIFPNIGIPVVAVVWTYIGSPLADADAPRALGMADT